MTEVVDGLGRNRAALSAGPLAARRRAATPVTDSPEGFPVRRQWGRLALGMSCTLLGGWLFTALYLGAGRREPVVVVARDVEQYAVIEKGDLTTERVAAGERADTIDGSRLDDLVGRVAGTDLLKGSVVAPSQIVRDESTLLEPGEASFGASLSESAMPPSLRGGDDVRLVVTAGTSTDAEATEGVPGWVRSIGEPDERNGERVVEFVVEEAHADELSAAAQTERLVAYLYDGG